MISYNNIARGGLCDRTFGFTFALSIAEIRNEPLNINWIKSTACPFDFDEIFDYPTKKIYVNKSNSNSFKISFNGCKGLLFCNNHKKLYDAYKDMINIPYENFCEVHKKCIVNLPFKNKKSINRKLQKYVGVHFRHTDVKYLKNKSTEEIKEFHEKFAKSLLNSGDSFFHICSDNKTSLNYLVSYLKEQGTTISFNENIEYDPSRRRQSSAENLVYDILCLSKCKRIYGNVSSGITQLSAIVSNTYDLEYYETTMNQKHKSFYKNWRNKYEQK